MYLQDDPRFFLPMVMAHGILLCMEFFHGFLPILILGFFGPFWREWGYVAINAQLHYIYGGRNNNVLNHFWWNIIVKIKNGGNNGGTMMYNYGLDHRELCGQFLALTDYPLMCEGRSSSYGWHTSQDQGRNGDNGGETREN